MAVIAPGISGIGTGISDTQTISSGGGSGEFITLDQFGGVADNGFDNLHALNVALSSGNQTIWIPDGTWFCSTSFHIPAGKILRGFGVDATTILWPQGVNGIFLESNSTLQDMTLDGTAVNDVIGGSGAVFLANCDGAKCINVRSQNWGFHGFASAGQTQGSGAINCSITNCVASNTGHRGINLSAGSTNNRVDGFQAIDCKRAGIILGYLSNFNVISNVRISGFSGSIPGAGLWVHVNSNYNAFSNFVIGPMDNTGVSAAHFLLEQGCQGNSFTNFIIEGADHRGIYLWNNAIDNPQLGSVNADISDNVFSDWVVNGTGTGRPGTTIGMQIAEDLTGIGGSIITFDTLTGGSGYNLGTYFNVPLTGGTGTGATGTIVVTAGAVSSIVITALSRGNGYTVGDILSADAANIGGAGTGFSVPVLTISIYPQYEITKNTFTGFTFSNLDVGIADLSNRPLRGVNTFHAVRFDNVTTPLSTTTLAANQNFIDCDTISNMGAFNGVTAFSTDGAPPTPLLNNITSNVQIEDLISNFALALTRFTADSSAPNLVFGKSRNATYGDLQPPLSSDGIGNLRFLGNDGAAFQASAMIQVLADGAHTTGSTPGRIVFLVTPTSSTALAEALRISQDKGVTFSGYVIGQLKFNNTSVPVLGGLVPQLQLQDTGTNFPASLNRFTNDASGPSLGFLKSRSGTYGTLTAPTSGDVLGNLRFFSTDGTSVLGAALISAAADGTQTSGSTPGRIVFSTTPASSTASVEVGRIDSTGALRAKSIQGIAVAFASLPAAPVEGMLVPVTNSTTATWGATISGGGANHVLAYYNGTNWTVAAA